MIRVNDHKQIQLFDPWDFLSPKRRDFLRNSWAGLFRDEILCELPVGAVRKFFNEGVGRPTKELHTMIGVLVLQQVFDLTDEQTIAELSFNIQWHYALNITEESDSAKYVSPKTLWNWRCLAVTNGLDQLIFDSVTGRLASVFDVNTDNQRLDSVHIKSDMQKLGRITIFVRSLNKFLVNLKRSHADLFETVGGDIADTYLPEKSLKVFSLVKPSDAPKTLVSVATDLFGLVRQFENYPEVKSMHTYKQLERVLKEQCVVVGEGDEAAVEIKKPKEIPSDSLQNPSDPDASYSGHKGQGFQAQIMETYCKDGDAKKETPNLITYVHVERAHESDANGLIPAIEATQKRDLGPKEALCDSLYGSDKNCEEAKELGVDVVAPTMGKRKGGKTGLSDFGLSDGGVVVSCPRGHEPIETKHGKSGHCAVFDSRHCDGCPENENCPAKKGKKGHYVRYTDKEARIAKRRAYEKTDEFAERYRWRAGVEATMSELDRRTGAKHLRVRGLAAVRYCVILKAVAINLFRATAAGNTRKPGNGGGKSLALMIRKKTAYIFEILVHIFGLNRQFGF